MEGIPTGYAEYAYAKRILYIDQDFFGLVLTELYDPHGEFWRFFLPCYFFTAQPYAGYPTHPIEEGRYDTTEERPFIPNALWVDVQEVFAFAQDFPSGYAKPAEWTTEWYFNAGGPLNSPETHSLGALRQMR